MPGTGKHKAEEKDPAKLRDLISLQDAAKLSGMSSSHIRLLIRQEEMWGIKIGRNWVTTELAIREYQARAKRRGRPKKGSSR
jgi:hypothetical protein